MIRLSGVVCDRQFILTLFASMKTRLVYFNALKYVHGLKFVQKQNNYLGGLFISQRGHSTCTCCSHVTITSLYFCFQAHTNYY